MEKRLAGHGVGEKAIGLGGNENASSNELEGRRRPVVVVVAVGLFR